MVGLVIRIFWGVNGFTESTMNKLNKITLALLFGAAPTAFAQTSNSEDQSVAIDTMVITAEAPKVETPC